MLFVFDLLLLVGNAVHCTQSLRWLLIWSYEPRTGTSTTTTVLTPAVTNVLVYDRNHLFGLGPKPKLKIGRNFRPIPKLTEIVKS